jgi:hypothetical protein
VHSGRRCVGNYRSNDDEDLTDRELLALSHCVGTTTVSDARPTATAATSIEAPPTAAENDLIDQQLLALSDPPDDTHQQHLRENVLSGEQAYRALRDAGCLLPAGETNGWAVTTEVVANRRSARIRDQQPRTGV